MRGGVPDLRECRVVSVEWVVFDLEKRSMSMVHRVFHLWKENQWILHAPVFSLNSWALWEPRNLSLIEPLHLISWKIDSYCVIIFRGSVRLYSYTGYSRNQNISTYVRSQSNWSYFALLLQSGIPENLTREKVSPSFNTIRRCQHSTSVSVLNFQPEAKSCSLPFSHSLNFTRSTDFSSASSSRSSDV